MCADFFFLKFVQFFICTIFYVCTNLDKKYSHVVYSCLSITPKPGFVLLVRDIFSRDIYQHNQSLTDTMH